ncbi:MAG: SH3 domain-containing protein [Candidatus Riflebacteria bacterium]|nr:SH3 domain-containing protein [Candidatus Riflebacteria bacterium]
MQANRPLRLLALLLGLLLIAPHAAHAARRKAAATPSATGVIAAPSGLFLRAKPDRNGKAVTRIPHGERVEILDREGPTATIEGRKSRWYQVRWGKATGWVFGGFVDLPGKAAPADQATRAAAGKVPLTRPDAPPPAPAAPTTGAPAATPAPGSPVVVPVEGPAGLGPKDEMLVDEEAAFLKTCAPQVTRQGGTLQIRLKNGKTATFTDNPSAEETAELFYFRGHLKEAGFFLLHRVSWEFSNYLLVNETSGARVPLDENPVFSPSGQRFVTACLDLEAGFVPNGLKVYRVAKGQATLEWSTSPKEWGPSEPRWQGENTILFQKTLRGGQTQAGRAEFAPKTKKWSVR